MKKIIVLMTLCVLGLVSFAQVTLERQVIATTGNYSTATGIQLSSTVGEPMGETLISGSLTLTQGFQQPGDKNNVGIEDLDVVLNYSIYPNPTTDKLFISLETDKSLSLTLRLTDMTGRQTGIVRDLKVNGSAKEELDMSRLASGQYLLHLLDAKNQAQKTFKVMKVD